MNKANFGERKKLCELLVITGIFYVKRYFMTINRKIWLGPFFEDEITKWPCPRCGKGHLLLVENTFKYSQLVDSRPNSEDWSPELSEYAYTTMLRCTNNSCNENFASCGSGYVT